MNTLLRRGGLLVSLLLVSILPARAEALVDDAGKFSIDMPAPYNRTTQDTDTAVGKVKIYLITHDGGNSAHIVGYNDYPAGSTAGKDPAQYYEGWANGQAGGMNGKIRSLEVHKLGSVVGRELIIDLAAQKITVRSRGYMVGDRLYQVMYLGAAGSENDPAVTKFLDSFRITE